MRLFLFVGVGFLMLMDLFKVGKVYSLWKSESLNVKKFFFLVSRKVKILSKDEKKNKIASWGGW